MAMSAAYGTKRHFVATHRFGRYWGKADIGRSCCLLGPTRLTPSRHRPPEFAVPHNAAFLRALW
jgi:hypothetical protein